MTVLSALALSASVSRVRRAEEAGPRYMPAGWAGKAGVHSRKLTMQVIAYWQANVTSILLPLATPAISYCLSLEPQGRSPLPIAFSALPDVRADQASKENSFHSTSKSWAEVGSQQQK